MQQWLNDVEEVIEFNAGKSCFTDGCSAVITNLCYNPSVNVTIQAANLGTGDGSKQPNKNSTVIRVDHKPDGAVSSTFLFPGDFEGVNENTWLVGNATNNKLGIDLKVRTYKVAHHGGTLLSCNSADLLALITPDIAVVSGGDTQYGHPSQPAMARVDASMTKTMSSGANVDNFQVYTTPKTDTVTYTPTNAVYSLLPSANYTTEKTPHLLTVNSVGVSFCSWVAPDGCVPKSPSTSPPVESADASLQRAVAPAAAADVSGVQVLSVSGCTDVGNTTTDCHLPATLNITIGNWTLSRLPYIASVGGFKCTAIKRSLDVVTCNLYADRGFIPRGVLLSVVVEGSAPFPGVSLFDYPFPRLTSVSGCTGSGTVTHDCLLINTTLTVVGTNFSSFAEDAWQINIGGRLVNVDPSCESQDLVTVVNDTLLTIDMSRSYLTLISSSMWGGTQTIRLYNGDTSSNTSVNFTLPPLPTPRVTNLWSRAGSHQCEPTSATAGIPTINATLLTCWPTELQLSFTGDYLYSPLNITIGGQPCVYVEGDTGWPWRVFCALNASAGLPLDTPFDLLISTAPTQQPDRVSNALILVSGPTVRWVSSTECASSFNPLVSPIPRLSCHPLSQARINITGDFFPDLNGQSLHELHLHHPVVLQRRHQQPVQCAAVRRATDARGAQYCWLRWHLRRRVKGGHWLS